ncbi:MAG: nucleotidyltransferase family protein [Verrucomicrobiae bacterium]|nr:nucleotidyltransferase family protein [Verrucomicrobiae bacterium]
MKAFLLAAGLGSRLRPLTDRTPKCLLPIGGRPMLQIWLEQMGSWGVTDVLVNTHHLWEQVEAFASTWRGKAKLHLAHEPDLLGSAGTLRANRAFVEGEESFLVLYADNLTAFRATLLLERLDAERERSPLAAMALFRSPRPKDCGIAALDAEGWVTRFAEKPREPKSDLANAGIYAFAAGALDLIPEKAVADIGHDLIPRLVPRIVGVEMKERLLDIGSTAAYLEVRDASFEEWANASISSATSQTGRAAASSKVR